MELILKAQNGDVAAQKELFFETVSEVYYICSKLLKSQNEAINACNATYKRVFSSLERLDPQTDFSSWVKTAAAITCCTELRRSDREIFLTLGIDKIGYKYPYFPKGVSLNMGETAEIMEECIDSLSVSKRAAIILYYFIGLSVGQIAKVLCVPPQIAKELLLEGRRKLEDLQWHLNDSGVKTCSMALLPIFELLSSILVIPDGIYFEEIAKAFKKKEEPAPVPSPAPVPQNKRKFSAKKIISLLLVVFLILGGGVFAATKVLNFQEPKKYSFGAELFSLNFDCVSPKLQEISPDSLFVFEKEDKTFGKIFSDYLITKVVIYNPHGEAVKSISYSYKNNTLVSAASSTETLSETLNYKWTKEGSRLTVTNSSGEVVEQTDHNSEGYPKKQIFGDDTVKYDWIYTYNDEGRIKTAKYSSDVSGNYSYKYDSEGRITYEKEIRAGIEETQENVYDEYGLITKKTITTDGGNKKIYTVKYDYNGLSFTASCSDGTSYQGEIIPAQGD